MAEDGQTNFLGGMRDNVSPERLEQNEYAFGENMELRTGFPETRRGSFRLALDEGTDLFQGADIYRRPDDNTEFIFVAQAENLFRFGDDLERIFIVLPDELTTNEVHFVQALNNFYLFRGENLVPMKWAGDVDSAFTLVDIPLTGDRMPGTAQSVLYVYNRFWIITSDDTLNISDALSESFNLTTQTFDVDQGDGGKLVKVHPFANGQLIAFKEKGIGIINNAGSFSTVADLTLQFIDNDVGCISADSITTIGADIFFLSRGGVYTLKQTSEQNVQLVDVSLSDPIRGLEQRVNWERAGNAQGVLFDNYYLLALPIDGSELNNAIFAYDLLLRKWVGVWRMVDSNSDESDTFWRHGRLFVKERNNRRLISIGKYGGISELLRGRHKDLVPTNNYFITFERTDLSDGDTIDIFAITSDTTILTKTTGIIEIKFRTNLVEPDVSGAGILIAFRKDSSPIESLIISYDFAPNSSSQRNRVGQLGKFIEVILANPSGSWATDDTLPGIVLVNDDQIHTVTVVQDGILAKVYVDCQIERELVLTGTLTGGEWFDDISNITRVDIGSGFLAGLGRLGHEGDILSIKITGSVDLDDPLAMYPFNEGTGTTINGYDKDGAGQSQQITTGTFLSAPNDPEWSPSPPVESDIQSILKTRGYTFGGIDFKKRLSRGEFTFTHMQPSLTVNLENSEPFDGETLFTDITFDRTKYEVKGQADWVNTNVNDDFETPFREDYAPIEMVTGFQVGLGGAEMDKRQEHTRLLHSMAIAEWFQLEFDNSQDMMGIKSTSLTAEIAGPERVRSIR